MRVAVTGVGGGIGQSVMKALAISNLDVEVRPVDVQPLSAGLYRGDGGVVLPRPESEGALDVWRDWLVAEKIDALIPGSDHDLMPLASVRDRWESEGVCAVLVSDPDLARICRDKGETVARLRAEGLPVPDSAWDLGLEEALAWADRRGYPIVVKPRSGFASRGVYVIADEEEMRFYYPRTADPILQEYLNLDGRVEEFTCAVFVDRDGEPAGTFMARRDLTGGATYRAEVGVWPEIRTLLESIGRALRPRGPLNVQLRMTERGPVPFELNLRCSGTTGIRSHFGYNEPEMLLRHWVLGEKLAPVESRTGFAFRYWNEIFLDGADTAMLREHAGDLTGMVRSWP